MRTNFIPGLYTNALSSSSPSAPISAPAPAESNPHQGNPIIKVEYEQAMVPGFHFSQPATGQTGLQYLLDLSIKPPGIYTIPGELLPADTLTPIFEGDPYNLDSLNQGQRGNCALLAIIISMICLGHGSIIKERMYDDLQGNIYVKLNEPIAIPIEDQYKNELIEYFPSKQLLIIKLPKLRAPLFDPLRAEPHNLSPLWLNLLEQAFEPFADCLSAYNFFRPWVPEDEKVINYPNFPDRTCNSLSSTCKIEPALYRLLDNIAVFSFDIPALQKKAQALDPYNATLMMQYALTRICKFTKKLLETYIVTAGTFSIDSSFPYQILPGHAYALCGIVDDNLQLINPLPGQLLASIGRTKNDKVPLPSYDLFEKHNYSPTITLAIDQTAPFYQEARACYNKIISLDPFETAAETAATPWCSSVDNP
ncbi:MAG: hypothetical protein RLZ12_961 [Bacillota bacterium]